jgi:integrase
MLPTASPTVEQWMRAWLRRAVSEVRPNTVLNYRAVIEKYVIPNIGAVKLDRVSATHLRRVYDSMLALGLSSTYTLNAHRIMSSAFADAVREGKIGTNPIVRVAAPRKSVVKLETLDLAEGLQVLAHAATVPQGVRWATYLLTGARRGEVIGIERSRVGDVLDLSWQLQRINWSHACGQPEIVAGETVHPCREVAASCPERRIYVPHDYDYRNLHEGIYLTRPKTSTSWRIIPLVEPLRSMLEWHAHEYPNDARTDLLFHKGGLPFDPPKVSIEWRRILLSAGIHKNVRLHDVRHTTVELLFAAGIPEEVIMQIVGHSTVAMTRSYRTRTDIERLRRAMEQFSAQFMSAPKQLGMPGEVAP